MVSFFLSCLWVNYRIWSTLLSSGFNSDTLVILLLGAAWESYQTHWCTAGCQVCFWHSWLTKTPQRKKERKNRGFLLNSCDYTNSVELKGELCKRKKEQRNQHVLSYCLYNIISLLYHHDLSSYTKHLNLASDMGHNKKISWAELRQSNFMTQGAKKTKNQNPSIRDVPVWWVPQANVSGGNFYFTINNIWVGGIWSTIRLLF